MRPVKVENETASFKRPPNWDESRDGPCGELSVRVETTGIFNEHYSNWQPDANELRMLIAGGVVELCCVGGQPPVSVGVVQRFAKPSYGLSRDPPS